MVWILIIGCAIAILNVALTYLELLPWFKSLSHIPTRGWANKMVYPFRWIGHLPKATPLALDGGVAVACGAIGLGGGVYGALIGLTIGFSASLLVKFHRHVIAPRLKEKEEEYA